jgi:predicted nucleic acid-binding protein
VNVLVDTPVWSLALRRKKDQDSPFRGELQELIGEGRAVVIGPIRQELLSGVKVAEQFELLRERLRAFPDLPLTTADYEDAASFYDQCRSRGIQGSNTDFLLCAVSHSHGLSILTTDGDFGHYARVLPITLHAPRAQE